MTDPENRISALSGLAADAREAFAQRDGRMTAWAMMWTWILVLMGGIAVDTSHVYGYHNRLQSAADASALAASRSTFEKPGEHMILPEIISKEPLGPLVRHGDNEWGDIVRWSFNALIIAEELGITSANADEMAKGTNNPEVNRLLGAEGEYGAMLGLDKDWALRAIKAGGNYGELFEKYIGVNTPIGLERGLNALWTQGGILYAPPFR